MEEVYLILMIGLLLKKLEKVE